MDERESVILNQMKELLVNLDRAKAETKATGFEQYARRYAILVTDMEKLYAQFYTFIFCVQDPGK
jgi:hypothetical protein